MTKDEIIQKIDRVLEAMECGPTMAGVQFNECFKQGAFDTACELESIIDSAYNVLEALRKEVSNPLDSPVINSDTKFRLTPAGRLIKWEDWHRYGGCMPDDYSMNKIGNVMGSPVFQWGTVKLGTLCDMCESFEGRIARYAFMHFPALGLAEAYY